ncbi:MAG: phenylalanine--tRNA ligase subunit beta [Candidatus Dependentiae bacterium]|nr:phenylalanine--tRNA ligase subunit beta [Candidatus Dependentiae bacterium]
MKLSISWVFDHIDADWKKLDINDLIKRFNQMVAEIEGFTKLSIDLVPFTLAHVTRTDEKQTALFSQEWQQECLAPGRKGIQIGQLFLIKKTQKGFDWALATDLGSGKDAILPALFCDESEVAGAWKNSFETEDYILELDNKSVTHRPDMWGHRGFAREIAAMFDMPLKPASQFLADKKVTQYTKTVPATKTNPCAIDMQAPLVCKRLAGMYLDNVVTQPSLLWMVHRLVRVDARPIEAIVDMTNYVMLEWGQPMHAFDMAQLPTNRLVPRMARMGESLVLLDGQTVELTPEDLVISDGDKALALAGVMGGRDSGISASTTSIIVESACFDAVTIRRTATRYKKRTEASARFEKSLDPNQNTQAVARFLKLMHDAKIKAVESDEIFSVGDPAQESTIVIAHDVIEKRLGVVLSPEFVYNMLTKLEFKVAVTNGIYTITIPTFRATKDIRIKEDIIEEIGRFYGYTNLAPELPKLQLRPAELGWVYRQRTIKQLLAHTAKMRELYSYAFFDEEFLNHVAWQPKDTLEVQSPVSENWRRLATSLVPGLLKAVTTASSEHDALRFFELGRTWHASADVVEKKSLAGVFFDKKNVDFYDAKALLQPLFDALKLSVEWVKVNQPTSPWYAPYQTAELFYNGTKIGVAGKMHPTFLQAVCQGDAFIFELDADFLLTHQPALERCTRECKYPGMVRDISMLVARDTTVDMILHSIAQVNTKISSVTLQDFFEKEEWPDQRAMTFRFVISDQERTMTKEEADVIWDAVAVQVKAVGAVIR